MKWLTVLFAAALSASAQIDPSIPLRLNTPQLTDPLELARRAQEIRNLRMQQQIQAQEVLRLNSPMRLRLPGRQAAKNWDHSVTARQPPSPR